ncbi:MAG TPA: DUF4340 domain-containing protein [Steroidobacteraceae bacterium]|nr:DUF4340 domain-containing protein [Steroidobacteraceae bacterium]
MSRQRFIGLIVAALVAISAALYFSTQRNDSREVSGLPLLPTPASEMNTVTSLSVFKGSPTPVVTVHKQGEQWTVAERANYPADVAKLRKLLLALSDAKIREEKTSDPANYSVIGVEDPTKPGATGTQIELIAKAGKQAVIVGKPVEQGNFVRRVGEKSSYIVEPGISLEAEPRYWIDTRLLDISADKIQSIQFKPETGPTYTVRRVTEPAPKPDEGKKSAPHAATAPAAADAPPAPAAPAAPAALAAPAAEASSKFVLEGVPSGRQAADSNALEPSPTAFSNLNDDDVSALGDIDFSKPSTVTLTLSDGSVITLTGAVVGEKRWIQVAAPKSAVLSAKANGRAFEIASYRYDQIFRPLEQLLVPKPVPTAKPAKKSAAAPKP